MSTSSLFAPSVSRANAVLMLHPGAPLTIGEIRRLSGEAHYAATQSALETLVHRGVAVGSARAGKLAFAPDRRSPAYPVAYHAALLDLAWVASLEAAGVRRSRVRAIYVHGSVARGDAGEQSDLDVLLIGDPEQAVVARAFAAIGSVTGRTVDVAVLRSAEVRDRLAAGDAALANILRAGIRVYGEFA
jgi:predicted nucleotidyltransferase